MSTCPPSPSFPVAATARRLRSRLDLGARVRPRSLHHRSFSMTKIALILGAHAILAEFVDVVTGDRIVPPGTFTPHNVDQRSRLIASGCISEDEVVDLSEKPVEDLTRPELEQLAT